jgi:ABC-2 type transport system ATP-binding protein
MKMELIAALLHRPRVLLLDEPTIGLDVVAQVAIQKCLRDYHQRHKVTVLLTSHYMRDIEALCRRVLVITHGKLVYDGELAGIRDTFGQEKILKIEFPAAAPPPDLSVYGLVHAVEGPTVELRVDRPRVAEVLSAVLAKYAVVDMSVQDPPLEQLITKVFEQGKAAV